MKNYIASAPCQRTIKEIIIHCSATPEGRDIGAQHIIKVHVYENGWSTIGYHFVVRNSGEVEVGRPLGAVGAHCKGKNATSVGICYVGGLDAHGRPKDTRTDAQKRSLKELIGALRARFPDAKVFGHRDFAPKACPCFDARKEYAP